MNTIAMRLLAKDEHKRRTMVEEGCEEEEQVHACPAHVMYRLSVSSAFWEPLCLHMSA